MREAMLHHMILADEAFIADLATVRLGAGVQAHMPSQIGLMVELFGALVTFEWLVAHMFSQVLVVRLVAWKAFAATLTFVRLVATVERFVMLGQVASFVKYLITWNASQRIVARGWYLGCCGNCRCTVCCGR